MKLLRVIEYLRNHVRTVVRISLALMGLLVLLASIPALAGTEHAHTWIEKIPGFWAVFGLVGCMVLIVASKAFGHAGIMKREDYYDE